MVSNIRQNILLFVKAQGSALVGTAVDFAMAIFLWKCCEIHYFYATMAGSICGGITNCIINYKYVFEDAHQKKRHVAMKYFLVWLGSILLNTYGTYFLTEITHINFLCPKVIVSVFVAVLWNYQLQRCFVYKNCHLERLLKK